MNEAPILANVRIVLVEPRGAFNIGSVVRAMKNMGFKDLALVDPVDFHNDDAYKACVGARDVLERASVFSTLEDAIRDTRLVVGTTRRAGRMRKIGCSLEELHKKIFPALKGGKAAVLFGREECGLSNRETDLCNILVRIPANPRFPSLNLSHAVAVVCYRLFVESMAGEASQGSHAVSQHVPQPVTNAALEELLDYMRFAFTDIGFFTKGTPSYVIPLFRRIFGRALLDDEELRDLTHIFHRLYGLFREKKRPAAK